MDGQNNGGTIGGDPNQPQQPADQGGMQTPPAGGVGTDTGSINPNPVTPPVDGGTQTPPVGGGTQPPVGGGDAGSTTGDTTGGNTGGGTPGM